MTQKPRRDVEKFRREYESAVHKLIPLCVGYSLRLTEGDEIGCDAQLEAIAAFLVDEFRLPRARSRKSLAAAGENVIPLKQD